MVHVTRARPPRRDVLPRVQRLRGTSTRRRYPHRVLAPCARSPSTGVDDRVSLPDRKLPIRRGDRSAGERGSPIVGSDRKCDRAVLGRTAARGCSRVPVRVRTNGSDRPPCPRGTPHVIRAPLQTISSIVRNEPRVADSPHHATWGVARAIQSNRGRHRQALHSLSDCPVVLVRQPRPSPGTSPHVTRVIPIASNPHRRARLRRDRESRHPAPIDGTCGAAHAWIPRGSIDDHGQRRSGLVPHAPSRRERACSERRPSTSGHVVPGDVRAHRGSPPPGKVDHRSPFSTTPPRSSHPRPEGERWSSGIPSLLPKGCPSREHVLRETRRSERPVLSRSRALLAHRCSR